VSSDVSLMSCDASAPHWQPSLVMCGPREEVVKSRRLRAFGAVGGCKGAATVGGAITGGAR
jgi:hypothetical protein